MPCDAANATSPWYISPPPASENFRNKSATPLNGICDKAKAWDDLMNKGTEAKGANCDNPVDRNMAVAERFGITGTPTLIAADGRKLPGAASASSISSWLDSGKTVQ